MKTRYIMLAALSVAILSVVAPISLATDGDAFDERPFIGVRVDPNPLPALLTKHLRLSSEQGLLIQNVQVGSPGDLAGLERDDIIVAFEGEEVNSYERFVDDIHDAGVNTEVSLEVIHLGERKTLSLTLVPFTTSPDWKYPARPDPVERFRPGRMFRLAPGDGWSQEIPRGEMPDLQDYFKKYFYQQRRVLENPDGSGSYEIIIDGDPDEPDTAITIRPDEGEEIVTTVDQIEQLPEKYRQGVRDLLVEAQEHPDPFGERFVIPRSRQPRRPFDDRERLFDLPRDSRTPFDPDDMDSFLRRQMRDFEERLKEMEKHQEDLRKKLEERDDVIKI